MRAMGRSLVVLLAGGLVSLASLAAGTTAGAEEPRARLARAPVPLDGIAAIVDEVFVFRSEINEKARHFEAQLSHDPIERRAQRAAMEKELVAHAIDAILIDRDCRRLHLEATDAEVSAAIDSVAQANKLTRKRLDEEIAKAGYSSAEYHDEIRHQLLEQRWLLARASGAIDRKKATDPVALQAMLQEKRTALVFALRSTAYIELR